MGRFSNLHYCTIYVLWTSSSRDTLLWWDKFFGLSQEIYLNLLKYNVFMTKVQRMIAVSLNVLCWMRHWTLNRKFGWSFRKLEDYLLSFIRSCLNCKYLSLSTWTTLWFDWFGSSINFHALVMFSVWWLPK